VNNIESVNGNVFYTMEIQAASTISVSPVELQNGTDNLSIIYANNTSAKISVDANSTSINYTYALNIKNNNDTSFLVRLENFNSSNLDKINTTIILHNSNTSRTQISIVGGSLNETGEYYNLTSLSTIYVKIENLNENIQSGTAYLYTYLRVKIPDSTYILYVITFEFR
jgi:hypothetical protein